MTKDEAKAYFLKIAKESGVADDAATQMSSAFDNDKIFQAFVPRPEVDRALSTEQAKYADFKKRNDYLEGEWLPSAKAAEAQAKAVYSKYQKYVTTYGEIDEGNPADVRAAAKATGLTKEEVTAILEDRINSQSADMVDMLRIQNKHFSKYKSAFPVDEFEAHVIEQRKKGNRDSLTSLYDRYSGSIDDKTTPHRFSDDDLKARDKRIADEAVKDFASRHRVPTDTRPRETHLLFDRLGKDKDGKDGKPNGEPSARDEFLSILSDPDPDTLKSRYPV